MFFFPRLYLFKLDCFHSFASLITINRCVLIFENENFVCLISNYYSFTFLQKGTITSFFLSLPGMQLRQVPIAIVHMYL